jgi:hypothetical protein
MAATTNPQAVEFLDKGLHPIRLTDADLVNPEAYDQDDAGKPHRPGAEKLWLIHDHGVTVCLVFAGCEQEALDIAVDENRMDRFQVAEADLEDYRTGTDSEGNPEYEGITYLGNACEPFDLETVGIVQIPVPKLSLTALLLAAGTVTTPKQYNTLPR